MQKNAFRGVCEEVLCIAAVLQPDRCVEGFPARSSARAEGAKESALPPMHAN
jgi:hypothetical protein